MSVENTTSRIAISKQLAAWRKGQFGTEENPASGASPKGELRTENERIKMIHTRARSPKHLLHKESPKLNAPQSNKGELKPEGVQLTSFSMMATAERAVAGFLPLCQFSPLISLGSAGANCHRDNG